MKGCFFRILFLPVFVSIGIFLFNMWIGGPMLKTLIENPPVAGIFIGLLFWFIWLSILDIQKYKKNIFALHNPNIQEGEPLVISGKINTNKDLLRAPFSGEPCLGYHYKVTHTSKTGSSSTEWTDYEGYALLPSVIRSEMGEFKILAEPNEEFFYEIEWKIYRDSLKRTQEFSNALERTKQYFNDTEFTETIGEKGNFRVDKKIGNEPNLEDCTLREKVIKVGNICLISGVCTFSPFGILPNSDSIMEPFRIVPNGEQGLIKKIRDRWVAIFVSLILAGVTTLTEYLVVIKK